MGRRQRLVDRREELGLSQGDVAHRARLTANSIRRYELGLSKPRGGDHRAYADALGWTPVQLSVAFSDDPPPINGHTVPGWLGLLASLEQAAGGIATFEPLVVPGLLQTVDYACAIEAVGPEPISDDEVTRKVENRMARQVVLDRPGFHLAAIIDESVLRRVAGGRDVMAAQLDHLARIAEHPAVELRVLPLDAGVFSAAFGAFTLFNSPESINPFMVCTECRTKPHYMDQVTDLDAHVALFAHLSESSLSLDASVELIQVASKEYR